MKRAFVLFATITAGAAGAHAAPRRLTLAEAVQLALTVDPDVGQARVQRARAHLGTLRAQLDRVSVKVDASVEELWDQENIGGSRQYSCAYGGGLLATTVATVACPDLPNPWNAAQTTPGTLRQLSDSGFVGLSNLTARVNFPVFSGFRVEANVTRAKLGEEAAIVDVRQRQKDTALAVARAFWAIRRLTMMLEAQEAALKRLVDAEAVAAARMRAGISGAVDRNRAVSRRLQQQAAVDQTRGELAAMHARLRVALGLNEEVELVDDQPAPSEPPPTLDALLPSAFKHRPELMHARLAVAEQHQQVRMARSSWYPQLSLVALFQYGNNPYSIETGANVPASTAANPFASMVGSFTAGAVLTVNLFDTFNTYTSSRDAEYEERRLVEDVRRSARLVDADVRVAHATLLELYAKQKSLATAREVSRDNLRILESRYRNGDALVIEYLDAQIELANVETQLADVSGQLQLQWLELQAALGHIVGVDHG